MLIENDKLKTVCIKSANNYFLEDYNTGLMLLFSAHSFHLLHSCLQDFYKTGDVDDTHYNLLLTYLENMDGQYHSRK